MQKKIDIDESAMKISSDAIQNADDENAEFEKLWTVETLQFDMNIDKESVPSLLDNDAEVNILLYHIVLALNLTIQTRVKVTMKDTESHKSVFLDYISNVSVWIGNVIVRQLFFILEKDINLCILKQSFKTTTCMTWQTCNDRSVLIIIFDSENDDIQTIFQPYSPGLNSNKKRHEMVETMTAQAVSKALNTKCGT